MKKLFLISCFVFLVQCSSKQIIPEPTLEQITIKTEPVCLNTIWYSPTTWFCYDGRPFSIVFRAVIDNQTGKSSYYLDYYIDPFDKDLPVGVSLKLDSSYYNLNRVGTEYLDNIKIISKVPDEVLDKAIKTKATVFSYSNRSESLNLDFSNRNTVKMQDILANLKKSVSEQSKLVIVK